MQTLLVIDPDAPVRDLLAASLEQDYKIQKASDLDGAVVRLRAEPPDFILTELPQRQLEHLHRLQYTWPDTPIIVITRQNDLQTAVDAMKLGVIDYLVKPVSASDLWMALGRAQQHHTGSKLRDLDEKGVRQPAPHSSTGPRNESTQSEMRFSGSDGSSQLTTGIPRGTAHRGPEDVLSRLRQLNEALAQCEDADSLHQQILDSISKFFGDVPVELFLTAGGRFESVKEADEVSLSRALLEQLSQKRSAVRVHSLPKHKPGTTTAPGLLEQLHLAAPMFDGDDLLGVVALGAKSEGLVYSPFEQEALATFASLCVPWLKAHDERDAPSDSQQPPLPPLEQAPVSVMLLNASRTIIFASQLLCEMTGHDQLEGHSAHILGDSFAEHIRGTSASESITECSIKHADGTEATLVAQVHLTSDGQAWVLFSDPHAFLPSREQLMRDMQIWSVVASEVAHHVRNGMVPLQSLTEIVAESGLQDVPETLCDAASEAMMQLDGFMTLLEPFSHTNGLKLQYTDLNIVLAKSIANSRRGAADIRQLNVQYTEPLPLILADYKRLQDAIEKLIQHCIAHVPPGETLHVLTTTEQPGDNSLTVEALLAYAVPADEWGSLRAKQWDVVLANVAQTILEHGGVFDTRQTTQRIEHHLRFPVES